MSDLLFELRAEQGARDKLDLELRRYRPQADANPEDTFLSEVVGKLESARSDTQSRITELEAELHVRDERRSDIARIAQRLDSAEDGAGFSSGTTRPLDPQHRSLHAFDESMRGIEDHVRTGEMTVEAAGRLDGHLREGDPYGRDAQYLAAVSQRSYATAFCKIMQFGSDAVLRMSDAERDAVHQANLAEHYRTALAEGAGATGGYAVPISIDPTLLLMSSGAINPMRQVCDVRPTSTLENRIVTTDGTTASYSAEAVEASDDSPTLVQPIFFVEKGNCFVPYSIEVGQDWTQMQADLAKAIADAKDVLEATKFLSGAGHGSNEPLGIATALASGSYVVDSASSGALGVPDVFALEQAVPFRWQPTMSYLLSPAMVNTLYRLVPRASADYPTMVSDDRQSLLGSDLIPYSAMTQAVTAGSQMVIAGDLNAAYRIYERVGMTIEVIPHLFGTNHRPTGQRGLYAWFRNTGGLVSSNDNAPARMLVSAAS